MLLAKYRAWSNTPGAYIRALRYHEMAFWQWDPRIRTSIVAASWDALVESANSKQFAQRVSALAIPCGVAALDEPTVARAYKLRNKMIHGSPMPLNYGDVSFATEEEADAEARRLHGLLEDGLGAVLRRAIYTPLAVSIRLEWRSQETGGAAEHRNTVDGAAGSRPTLRPLTSPPSPISARRANRHRTA